jgi:hypothetical protein
MRISRLVLSGAAIGTILGTGRADLNRTHVFNPNWPPHARFHGAAGWGTFAGSQLLALWLIWHPGRGSTARDLAIKTAALLPTTARIPLFPALATAGTSVEDQPGQLPPVAAYPRTSCPQHWYPPSPRSVTCCTAADCKPAASRTEHRSARPPRAAAERRGMQPASGWAGAPESAYWTLRVITPL